MVKPDKKKVEIRIQIIKSKEIDLFFRRKYLNCIAIRVCKFRLGLKKYV